MITTWNNATAKLLAADIENALRTVAIKHGLNPMAVRGMKIAGASSLQLKIEAVIKAENLSQQTKATSQFARILDSLNLPIGTVLHSDKFGDCTVYDYASKSPAYPILAKTRDGKTIKFTTNSTVVSRPAGFVVKAVDEYTKEAYGTKRRRQSRGFQF
jgi:hypothetical protein